jgi:hypothetical protein
MHRLPICKISIGLAVFCISYAVINLLLQEGGIVALFKKDNLEILVSRLFAVLSCVSIFGSFYKILLYKIALIALRNPGDKVYKNFLNSFFPGNTDFNLLAFIEIRNLTQVTIFLFSLFALQLDSYLNSETNTYHLALYITLKFLIDDWKIINDYISKYQIEMLTWHKVRVVLTTIFILISLVVMVYNRFPALISYPFISCIAIVLFYRYYSSKQIKSLFQHL